MRRSLVGSLIAFVVLVGAALTATLVTGTKPQLGLDLQGGASVVLQPRTKVDPEVLVQAIEIIRSRVDALGVAEPEISSQGESIIVQLPGVKNTDQALAVVGQTAQLYFRPVLDLAVGDEPVTPPEANDPTKDVILPVDEGAAGEKNLRLGPAEVRGEALSAARATLNPTDGTWSVDFELTAQGGKDWDAMAAKVGAGRRIAMDLDGVVKSAPVLRTTTFGGEGQITGDFDEREAKDLALVLRYGSLPVQLDRQTVQTVSASLGQDSLRAGLFAGFLGLALVAIYMVLYYRALGFVVWVGLVLSGALMYSIVSFLGARTGLSLTLAGAVGIIVSVGVTVDSYVVYFERLKDEVRAGRTIRSSVDRGFVRAYKTIFAADLASLIGAGVLFFLSVGSVRGFAFFLGLSTLLDLVVAYVFTRPVVVLLGRSSTFAGAGWLGVARGLAAVPAAAAAGTGRAGP